MNRCPIWRLAAGLIVTIAIAACSDGMTAPRSVESSSPAQNTTGVFVDGNPSCTTLGLSQAVFATKYNSSTLTYQNDAKTSSTVFVGDNDFTMTRTAVGTFNWASNPGSGALVHAVIVKGGSHSNVYYYNPAATSGTGLTTILNISNNQYSEISHVELCYSVQLQLSTTVSTSFDRAYAWTIDKSSATTALTLTQGQASPVPVSYTVAVTPNSGTDSNWLVTGTFTVTNPAHVPAIVSTVTGNGINCGTVTFPATLAAGASFTCSYSGAPGSGASGSYTYTATTTTPAMWTGSAAANYAFNTPTLIDNCVNVTDNLAGALGQKCVGNTSLSFTYSLDFLASSFTCGANQVVNTASFAANTTGANGSDGHTVGVTLTCPTSGGSCTLSQGYWKNHGDPSTKRYDDTWALLAGGQGRNTQWFTYAGHTWGSIWGTPPAGNAYFTLAHQYMAAELNKLNGANPPSAVATAIANAKAFFTANGPGAKLSGTARTNAQNWAAVLEAWNAQAPYHCSE